MSDSDDAERTIARGIQRQKDTQGAIGLAGALGCLVPFGAIVALSAVLHVVISGWWAAVTVVVPLVLAVIVMEMVEKRIR